MMSDVPSIHDDEVDLISLIQTVWDGRWKIVCIMAVCLLSIFGYDIISKKTFTASTEIKPITSFKMVEYSLFNASLKIIEKEEEKEKEKEAKSVTYNIFEVTRKTLLNLYIEQIEEGSLLVAAIDKFNLINKDDFDSEYEYREAVEKFASEIKILSPIKKKNGKLSHHVLIAEYDDEDKWKDLLAFVDDEANRKVKASIINNFATIVSIQNQEKNFAIKDINRKINNIKTDYERNTKDRVAYLSEQAAIARKLDIQKNTIASERFSEKTIVTNVKTDAPFYLRGYLAIEEEIRQIKNRKNKNSFINGLFKLEQKRRDIEQDKTIKRAIELFDKTPLNQNDFKATIVKVPTTTFVQKIKPYLYYVLAIFFGGIVGVVYVLIAKSFASRRINTVSS